MKRTIDLYGVSPSQWAELPYKDALSLRARLASNQAEKWRRFAFKSIREYDAYNYCVQKYIDCKEAEKFNRALLDELEYGDIPKQMEAL